MKYLKYVFGSLLLAGALGLAGCGSGGDANRSDGDRNVIKEITVKRDVRVEGVVRSYKTGAPLSNVEVTLYQAGKKVSVSTVGLDGHYAFAKVQVSDDKSVGAANNAANAIQLEFSEIKVKNDKGGKGNTHYDNGTQTPTFPDSRLEFTLASPEFTASPNLSSADHSADILAGGTATTGDLGLVDAINEGRSYYFTDANTVLVRDVRLVQVGKLSGTTVDADTGLPVNNAVVTLSTDNYFPSATQISGAATTGDDIVAVWQNTRISTTSDVNGAFTFTSVPALDYSTSLAANINTIHVERKGYLERAGVFPDHSNIRDDLEGSLGTLLLTPIKVTTKTVTMKFVDQNRAALAGVNVTLKYDAGENDPDGYGVALTNGIATETIWTATSDANGLVTMTVPNINYNVASTSKDAVAKLTGYKLDLTFTPIALDDTTGDFKVPASTNGGVDRTLDLGVIKMIPDTKNFAKAFRIQLIYSNAPVVGATVKGIAKYLDADTGHNITILVAGDAASDVNGFVTFNTNKIPATKAGLAVTFDFDVSLTGATSIVSDLSGTYVVNDADKLDLTDNAHAVAAVFTEATNNVVQITLIDKLLKLAGLEGYIVTGKSGGTDKGTISFAPFDGARLSLLVDKNGVKTTYFAKTNTEGYYIFKADDGVEIPVGPQGGTGLDLKLTILGDFIFSGTTNTITLDNAVPAANGVDQIDSNGTLADTSWLWQLNDTTANELENKYADKVLQVHTAAIEPNAAVETGFHVVTLLKTVASVNTTAVIQTNLAGNKVYTYTKDQDDGTGIQIVMSKAVDATKPFIYDNNTTSNNNADTTDYNRLEIIGFELGTQNNEIPDGQVLVYTATASGRTITIKPAGNANKFQQQVTYRLKVRAVSTDGNVSDDTLYFRFFDKAKEIFSTEKPAFDVSSMTTGDYWFLYNNVAADADNVKVALNRVPGGAILAADVHFLVYKDGTGFSYATGGIQNRAVDLNNLKLRFNIPTDLKTGVAAVTTNAAVLAELPNIDIYAQAYTTSGVILQHWTKVGAYTAVGNQFLNYEAGLIKASLDLSLQNNIWAKALAEGNKIDITAVHKNSQINPTDAKVLTIDASWLSGVQAKDLAFTGADGNPVTPETITITLDSEVNATSLATPTLSTTMQGVTISNVRYSASNEIKADAKLSFAGTPVTVSATTSLNVASANIMVKPSSGANSSLILSTATTTAVLQTLSNEMRVGRNVSWDADGATATTSAVNSIIASVNTFVATSIPIISGANKDYGYNNVSVISDNGADNSTATAVDIDRTGGAALTGNAVGNVDSTRTWDIKYVSLTDGRLRRLLNNLEAGDIINASGANFYLAVTGTAANTISLRENGNFSADVRAALGYDGTASTLGGSLVIAPQIRVGTAAWVSDDTTSGIALAVAAGSDPSTGFRAASNTNGTIIDSTTIELNVARQFYVGDTIYILTQSITATDGNEPVYSATVAGAISSGTVNTTLLALSGVTQVRGTTEAFAAQGQTVRTNGVVFAGDTVKITSLGTGVTSLHNPSTLNTNGDEVTNGAYTDGVDVQNNGKGFKSVK